MPFGRGQYDDHCSNVLAATDAKAVIVIVIEGNKGTGFSCQADLLTMLRLPQVLENVAREIRKSGV